MHIEYECTMLEVNKEELEGKLKSLGAIKKGDYFQKRYTYNYLPDVKGKWLRLRTNGEVSTLAIKNITDKNLIGGTQELEVEVSSFEDTRNILEELGFKHNNYQENKRTVYVLDEVEISIDTWPMIPTYAEVEGKCEEDVLKVIDLIGLNYEVTNLDVASIYEEIYGIKILDIKNLKFD